MATTVLQHQITEDAHESLTQRLVRMPAIPETRLSHTKRITWDAEREVLCTTDIDYIESITWTGKRTIFPLVYRTWAKRSNSGQLLIGQSEPGRGITSHVLWRGVEETDETLAQSICRRLFHTIHVESTMMDKALYLAQQTPSMAESHPFLVEWAANYATDLPPLPVGLVKSEIRGLSSEFARRLVGVTDARQAVAALFGKRAVRKDMIKVLATSQPKSVETAWLVRDMRLLPVDHLVTLLRNMQEPSSNALPPENDELYPAWLLPANKGSYSTWRSLLQNLEPASRKRLLKRLYRHMVSTKYPMRLSTQWRDTIRMAQQTKKRGIAWPTTAESLTELHDLLSDRLNHYERQARQEGHRQLHREEFTQIRRKALIELVSETLGATGDQLAGHPLLWETIEATNRDQIIQKADQMEREQRYHHERETARREAEQRRQNAGRLLVADRLSEVLESMSRDLPESMELIVARDANTLWAWGDTLGHCIGGYDHQRTTGRSILFGITHPAAKNNLQLLATGEVIIYVNVENNWSARLTQLYSRRNRELPTKQNEAIGKVVAAAIAATEVTPEQIQATVDQATTQQTAAA